MWYSPLNVMWISEWQPCNWLLVSGCISCKEQHCVRCFVSCCYFWAQVGLYCQTSYMWLVNFENLWHNIWIKVWCSLSSVCPLPCSWLTCASIQSQKWLISWTITSLLTSDTADQTVELKHLKKPHWSVNVSYQSEPWRYFLMFLHFYLYLSLFLLLGFIICIRLFGLISFCRLYKEHGGESAPLIVSKSCMKLL